MDFDVVSNEVWGIGFVYNPVTAGEAAFNGIITRSGSGMDDGDSVREAGGNAALSVVGGVSKGSMALLIGGAGLGVRQSRQPKRRLLSLQMVKEPK